MNTRKEKIARLLDSPIEGEREAARAALGRLIVDRPVAGSPDWCEAMIAHRRIVSACALHIDNPNLTPHDVATVRRWARFGGNPWEDGAEDLMRIHRQLMRQDQDECLLSLT